MKIEEVRKESIKVLDNLHTMLEYNYSIVRGDNLDDVTVRLKTDDLYNLISAVEIYICKLEYFYE